MVLDSVLQSIVLDSVLQSIVLDYGAISVNFLCCVPLMISYTLYLFILKNMPQWKQKHVEYTVMHTNYLATHALLFL